MAKSKTKQLKQKLPDYCYSHVEPSCLSVDLDLRQFAVQYEIDKWMAKDNLQLEKFVDYSTQRSIVRLRAMVYGRDMKTVEVSYPADWKEHFKQRWFPAWAKAKWPVKYRTEKLVAEELYPHIALPDREDAVIRVYKD